MRLETGTTLALRHVIALSLAFLILLTGCGERPLSQRPGTPAEELREASETTLALESFRVQIAYGEDAAPVSIVDYQSPDRFRVTDASGDDVMVAIGADAYLTTSEGSDEFFLAPDAYDPHTDVLIWAEAIDQAVNVHREGNEFLFEARVFDAPDTIEGKATIVDGRLSSVRLHLTGEYPLVMVAGFDYPASIPAIERPAEDRIVPAPTLPPCDPSGQPPAGELIRGPLEPA